VSKDETPALGAKKATRNTPPKRRIAENEFAKAFLRLQNAQEREQQRSREKLKEFILEFCAIIHDAQGTEEYRRRKAPAANVT
jgi:hypothetical protein